MKWFLVCFYIICGSFLQAQSIPRMAGPQWSFARQDSSIALRWHLVTSHGLSWSVVNRMSHQDMLNVHSNAHNYGDQNAIPRRTVCVPVVPARTIVYCRPVRTNIIQVKEKSPSFNYVLWNRPVASAKVKQRDYSQRILLFTDPTWCRPCQHFEANVVPVLKKDFWKIGTGTKNDIQVIYLFSVEGKRLAKIYRVKSIPSMVFIGQKDGIGRLTGDFRNMTSASLRAHWKVAYGW